MKKKRKLSELPTEQLIERLFPKPIVKELRAAASGEKKKVVRKSTSIKKG
jgi:hypothetical protein